MIILIAGAAGRVGRLLEECLEGHYPHRVVSATRQELDLGDPDRVAMEIERLDPRPTVVINCAAITHPAEAEAFPEETIRAHREGVGYLARACREIRCRFLHFSTAEVFDGKKLSPYVEEDIPSSDTQHGRIRHLGELAAAGENPDHLVLRLSLLCGDGGEEDPVFKIMEAAEKGRSLPWQDRRVSPIFAEDLASTFPSILRSDWKGVLHLANGGSCLLSELAAAVAGWRGLPAPDISGGPGPSSFRPGSGANAALDASRFAVLGGRRLRSWKDALGAMMAGSGEH